ncbi:MAG: tyrosine-type recombinase/integrase [Actinomycetota bacterium]|nr:tyrosine-type recombinase/integrase [Actinomycetota bacterium]
MTGTLDWQAWKTLPRKAEVPEVRLHDGRHTAATLLLSSGAHPRVVMELLGHSQMRTTTDTYSHVMPALAREAAERMGDALWAEWHPWRRMATTLAPQTTEGVLSNERTPWSNGWS